MDMDECCLVCFASSLLLAWMVSKGCESDVTCLVVAGVNILVEKETSEEGWMYFFEKNKGTKKENAICVEQ